MNARPATTRMLRNNQIQFWDAGASSDIPHAVVVTTTTAGGVRLIGGVATTVSWRARLSDVLETGTVTSIADIAIVMVITHIIMIAFDKDDFFFTNSPFSIPAPAISLTRQDLAYGRRNLYNEILQDALSHRVLDGSHKPGMG
jgi:hypothetical protein